MTYRRLTVQARQMTVLTTAGLFLATGVVAQTDPVFPGIDTPVGQRLVWALEAVQPGSRPEPADVFVPEFFERIPRSAVIDEIRSVAGKTGGLTLVSAWSTGQRQLMAAAQAMNDGTWWRVVVTVEDQPPYGITRLGYSEAPQFGPPAVSDWIDFREMLGALGGKVSFAAYHLEESSLKPLLLHNSSLPLATGSTFKLWVLGALAEVVSQGGATWAEELPIREERKSLPSGRMQTLAEGEMRTLAEYAMEMISNSDNTATDHLIHRIGREQVEDYAFRHGSPPGRNRPFLTTNEFFKLKINAGSDLMESYISASEEVRRGILEGPIARLPLPNASDEPNEPTAIDQIEWFASASALSQLIVDLAALGRSADQAPVWEALTRNPGFDWNRNIWPVIAYKGGLEAGVVNLTWLMERHDGQRFVMSLGVNDPLVVPDRDQIILTAAAAGKLLEREG